jgi:hypothetical protein
MRYFLIIFCFLIALVVSSLGFRGSISRQPPLEVFPDMDRQPKLRPQKPNNFFPDGRSSQLPVLGTIARGDPYEDSPFNTGRISGTTNFVEISPLVINAQVMARGRERYQISCLPCHGAVGDGNGITRKYGMAVVGNMHDKRMVSMPDGELFHVITHGRNLMGPYGALIPIEDRWAIVAYVRALQLSRLGAIDDVPAENRGQLP